MAVARYVFTSLVAQSIFAGRARPAPRPGERERETDRHLLHRQRDADAGRVRGAQPARGDGRGGSRAPGHADDAGLGSHAERAAGEHSGRHRHREHRQSGLLEPRVLADLPDERRRDRVQHLRSDPRPGEHRELALRDREQLRQQPGRGAGRHAEHDVPDEGRAERLALDLQLAAFRSRRARTWSVPTSWATTTRTRATAR